MVHFHNLKLYYSKAVVMLLSYFTGDDFMQTCLNISLLTTLMLVRLEVSVTLALVSIQ